MQNRLLLLILGLACLFTGCVTEVIEKETLAETRLIITRAGDEATLQWQSSPGISYTVLYSGTKQASARWTPLPGVIGVMGDGTLKKYKDRVPYGRERYYRIQAQPLAR